jgi:prepilin-type N-terminal cleavage/methylation domain-containing protein
LWVANQLKVKNGLTRADKGSDRVYSYGVPDLLIRNNKGFSLIELILVIVIAGILASVAMRSMTAVEQTTRFEQTRHELDRLAWAMVGNPELVSDGHRVDFGYVGDIGALPSDPRDLLENRANLGTWRGPYIQDNFFVGSDRKTSDMVIDAWGKPYQLHDASLRSVGGKEPLTRQLANSAGDLLHNKVEVVVTDFEDRPPGVAYEGLQLALVYPDGKGSYNNRVVELTPDGRAVFDEVPIGLHSLHLIDESTADTLTRRVVVYPGRTSYSRIRHYRAL